MNEKGVTIRAPRCPNCGEPPYVIFNPNKNKITLTCSGCHCVYKRAVAEFALLVEGATSSELSARVNKASRARAIKDERHTKKIKVEHPVGSMFSDIFTGDDKAACAYSSSFVEAEE